MNGSSTFGPLFAQLPKELTLEPPIEDYQYCHDLVFEREDCLHTDDSLLTIHHNPSQSVSNNNVALIYGNALHYEECRYKAHIERRSQMCMECNVTGEIVF